MTKYMMATKAYHKLGDLSRKDVDLCIIESEDEENYIGRWVSGFGFFRVKFPKETTRELTEDEISSIDGSVYTISGQTIGRIKLK